MTWWYQLVNFHSTLTKAFRTTQNRRAAELFKKTAPSHWNKFKGVYIATLQMIVFLGLGVLLYISTIDGTGRPPQKSADEGTALLVDAIYFSMVTASSVGYGDLLPKTDRAKLLVAAYVLVATPMVAYVFSAIAAVPAARQARADRAMSLQNLFDSNPTGNAKCQAEALSKRIAGGRGDDKIDETDFVLYMLLSGGEVDSAVVEELRAKFKILLTHYDKEADGKLNMDEVNEIIRDSTAYSDLLLQRRLRAGGKVS